MLCPWSVYVTKAVTDKFNYMIRAGVWFFLLAKSIDNEILKIFYYVLSTNVKETAYIRNIDSSYLSTRSIYCKSKYLLNSGRKSKSMQTLYYLLYLVFVTWQYTVFKETDMWFRKVFGGEWFGLVICSTHKRNECIREICIVVDVYWLTAKFWRIAILEML